MEINRHSRQTQRDLGVDRCNNHSELSGMNGYVEASHLNHDKTDVEVYLSQDVIVMCTPVEHYAYHLMFKGNAHLIGLTEENNEFAIAKCFDRAIYYLGRHHDIDFRSLPRVEKIKIIERAWNFWSYYLEIPFFDEIES